MNTFSLAVCFSCVDVLLFEPSVMEDVNVTVDVTAIFNVTVISILLVKTSLEIKVLVSIGVINSELCMLTADVAAAVSDVVNDFRAVNFLASLVLVFKVVVDVSSVLVVVSSCVETGLVAVSANSEDVKKSMRGSSENG